MLFKLPHKIRDDKAQLLTLDLLLSLIPIVLVLGISANTMTGVVNQIQGYVYNYEMQHIVDDAADILVKTPGDPPDWSWLSAAPPSILGLAQYNTLGVNDTKTYYLETSKFLGLDQMFNTTMPPLLANDSTLFDYIRLSFKGASENTTGVEFNWTIGDRTNASNIYFARRVTLVKLQDMITEWLDISHEGQVLACYQGSTGNQPAIYYYEFNLTALELSTFDYWIYAESDDPPLTSYWGVDRENATGDFNGDVTPDCEDYFPIHGGGKVDTLGGIYPCPTGGDNDPGEGSPVCDPDSVDGWTFKKVQIDDELIVGGNRIFIQMFDNPFRDSNAYLIRSRAGTGDSAVDPAFTVFTPFYVDLEAGR
jgi:hypothetical protein